MLSKTELMNKATRCLYKTGYKLKQRSPEILAVVGTVGIGVGVVKACQATTKLEGIMAKSKKDVDTIKEVIEHPELVDETYTPEDGKKDLAIVYARTGVELVKLYAPAAAILTVSVGCLLYSNKILRKRNLALAATYAAVDKQFKEYRGRVVERFGESLDRELRYNIKAKEIEETVTNEDGTESVVKRAVDTVDAVDKSSLESYSRWAFFFDDGCLGWDPDPSYSKMHLLRMEDWINEKCEAQGFLTVNDIYEGFGIPKIRDGQTHGWIYEEGRRISLGLFDIHRPKNRDFVNGYEKVVLIDLDPTYIINKL